MVWEKVLDHETKGIGVEVTANPENWSLAAFAMYDRQTPSENKNYHHLCTQDNIVSRIAARLLSS